MAPIGSDLPAAVDEALASATPDPGVRSSAIAAGIEWSSIAWGVPGDRPVLLVHGVTASARIWWRVGPAIAASGRRVIAVDLPGHGQTAGWLGHHRFRDNAIDLAAWIRVTWVVRGDPLAGSLLPDAGLSDLSALVGPDHLITLEGAPHAPQRTHARALVTALLTALG